jgi:hypothetical protein
MDQNYQQDIAQIKQQVSELCTAIMGNPISRDGGIAKRLNTLEDKLSRMEKFTAKIGWQVGLLWLSAGVIITGVFTLIIKK